MPISEIIALTTITTLAVMSPGPDFAIVTKNSLLHSRRAGIFTAAGIALGLTVHIIYSLVGIGFIIAQSILLFNVIKFIGAGYLIYLGVKALFSKSPNKSLNVEFKKENDIRPLDALKMGVLTNALNPKVTLFFLGFLLK